MTTTPLLASLQGQTDLSGQFSTSQALALTTSGANDLMVVQFSPNVTNTAYWIESSTTLAPELSLTLPIQAGGSSGAPFYIYVVAPSDGTLLGLIFDGVDLPAQHNVYSLDDSFTQPKLHSIPAGAKTLGVLAAKYRVAANVSNGNTITVPLDMAALIPAITNQSWTGKLYLNIWVGPGGGGTPSINLNTGAITISINLSTATLTTPNRDTGRSGKANAQSPYQRCPVTGFTVLGEEMVSDGYRDNTLVSAKAFDPPEPPPRPDIGEQDWYPTT